MRIANISFSDFYRADRLRGGSYNPKAEGYFQTEGVAYIKINSEGLRDEEHSKSKKVDTFRIAILGDSFAAALQVPLKQTFGKILENELGKCERFKKLKIETINFGVDGYGTLQELLTLRNYVWEYNPDLILLAFFTGNDIRNNSAKLEPEKMRPFLKIKDNNIEIDNSFLKNESFNINPSFSIKIRKELRRYSRVYRLLSYLKKKALKIFSVKSEFKKNKKEMFETDLEDEIYLEPQSPEWVEAWAITEYLLLTINYEIKKNGKQFLVVTLTNGLQVHPDLNIRKKFMPKGVNDPFYPDHRIKNHGLKNNYQVLNLVRAFETYAEKNKIYLHGFEPNLGIGHWNSNGHKFAGELIAQHICKGDFNYQESRISSK